MRQALVRNQGRPAGLLTEYPDGSFSFAYLPAYLAAPQARPVSLTLPLGETPHKAPALFPFFLSLVSEGANRRAQCQALGIDPDDDFGLLLATAHTDTIGAITLEPYTESR